MDTDPTPPDTEDHEKESDEDAEELAFILDEVDGPTESFQKYYNKFMDKFKSSKRAKAKRKKVKEDAISEPKTSQPSPKPAVDEHEYDFYNKERGMAVIINNETFNKEAEMKNRKGTVHDASALEEMFQSLGFHVKRYDNLKVHQMVLKLQEVASNIQYDHEQADCFACAILSHGGEEIFKPKKQDDPTIRHDVVFGVDGKMVPTRYLLSIFNDECCPELEGKPRLFFIQACRGSKMDDGTKMKMFRQKKSSKKQPAKHVGKDDKDAVASESEEESDSEYYDAEESTEPPEEQRKDEEKQTTEKIHKTEDGEIQSTLPNDKKGTGDGKGGNATEKDGGIATAPPQGGRGTGRASITVSPTPIYKDFLLMYAAPPGYFAWRRDTGGWLIQTLKEVMTADEVTRKSLTNLLTKVSWTVANGYESVSSKHYLNKRKLVPCIMSMLTKDIYFRKKDQISI